MSGPWLDFDKAIPLRPDLTFDRTPLFLICSGVMSLFVPLWVAEDVGTHALSTPSRIPVNCRELGRRRETVTLR